MKKHFLFLIAITTFTIGMTLSATAQSAEASQHIKSVTAISADTLISAGSTMPLLEIDELPI